MTKFVQDNKKVAQINENIQAEQVRLIDSNGAMVGIVPIGDALRTAYDSGLDLVAVSHDEEIPVCKVLDYGKYRYDTQKKKQEAKKKQKTVDVKEIQLRPSIGENDLLIKCRAAEKFLKAGNKVKVALRFRGRETAKPEIGFDVVQRMIDYVADYAKPEHQPKLDGQTITTILTSKARD